MNALPKIREYEPYTFENDDGSEKQNRSRVRADMLLASSTGVWTLGLFSMTTFATKLKIFSKIFAISPIKVMNELRILASVTRLDFKTHAPSEVSTSQDFFAID